MRQSVLELCDMLISNRDVISKSFFAEFGIMEVGASMVFQRQAKRRIPTGSICAKRYCLKTQALSRRSDA